MDEFTNKIIALLLVIGIGLMLGRISWRGISLGTSGVVFVALAAGHFGVEVPRISGVAGIVLFVYCLGIGAGPGFLRMFLRQGKALALMTAGMILSAGLATYLFAVGLDLSPGLASGLLAGALTSTPALAAATDQIPDSADVAVGFGVAYPFGVIGVIVFVQLMSRLMQSSATSTSDDDTEEDGPIVRMLIKVNNPQVAGKRLRDVATLAHSNCQVSRVMMGSSLHPIPASFQLQLDQLVLAVGAKRRLAEVIEVLGEQCTDVDYVLDVERNRRRVVVTSRKMIGQSLEELHLLTKFGVTISRITRQDIEFVPGPQSRIEFGDALTAIGESEGLDRFIQSAGHRERTLDETDLTSLAFGLVLGILAGRVEFTYREESISLGLAGGPLLVGLVLGNLGHVGPIMGRIPRAARLLLSEIGLALFLAQAGSQAGQGFVGVLRDHGFTLPLVAMALVTVPLLVGLGVAKYVLKLGPLAASGGICGAMTSTPALGAITSQVDSSIPATSYATVYPLALVLITILTPLLIAQLT